MARTWVVLVLLLVFLSSSSCMTVAQLLTPKSNEVCVSEPSPDLTTKENYYLQLWLHAAELAEDVEDYETAIFYYTKIVEYFPGTKAGSCAKQRLAELIQTQNKNDQASVCGQAGKKR